MRERLLRTLADAENMRERTQRAAAEAKQFAVQVRACICGRLARARDDGCSCVAWRVV